MVVPATISRPSRCAGPSNQFVNHKGERPVIRFNDQPSASLLSIREHQVLELVAEGMSAKRIAQQLEIAPRTVERHIENIRNKLRATNKTQMIAKALAFGLIKFETSTSNDLHAQLAVGE
jgi:DNA-binding CsgD family transcriptional regulator